jgi:hypothetical protein
VVDCGKGNVANANSPLLLFSARSMRRACPESHLFVLWMHVESVIPSLWFCPSADRQVCIAACGSILFYDLSVLSHILVFTMCARVCVCVFVWCASALQHVVELSISQVCCFFANILWFFRGTTMSGPELAWLLFKISFFLWRGITN